MTKPFQVPKEHHKAFKIGEPGVVAVAIWWEPCGDEMRIAEIREPTEQDKIMYQGITGEVMPTNLYASSEYDGEWQHWLDFVDRNPNIPFEEYMGLGSSETTATHVVFIMGEWGTIIPVLDFRYLQDLAIRDKEAFKEKVKPLFQVVL